MPNLTLSNEQVIDLFKQLPEAQQKEVYKILILSQWRQLEPVFNEGAERARIVAKEEKNLSMKSFTKNSDLCSCF